MRFVLPLILTMISVPAIADDRVPLNQDPELEYGLMVAAQGAFMRKFCDEISLRIFKTLGLMNSLKSRAKALGYSNDEVKAYLGNKDEKTRVGEIALADLEAVGFDLDDPSTFCPVAKAQIASGERFGPYFWVN